MLVSIFPDERTVLLRRHERDDPVAEHHSRYHIPDIKELLSKGVEIPDQPWEFARRHEESVAGLFLKRQRLEHLLTKKRLIENEASFEIVGRREAADLLDIDDYWAMNRAFHLAYWDRDTQFCSACATPMERNPEEISKRCPSCGKRSYPVVSPAVIMAVVKDGALLMAHSSRHPGNLYSVLAGFVEAGETLEHAVSREVFEESGVLVRNIEYFSSQPWPFPNSLMIAFTAEYAGGDLLPEPGEIDAIDWFVPAALPKELPSQYSVARRLIEWFVTEYGNKDDLQRLLSL